MAIEVAAFMMKKTLLLVKTLGNCTLSLSLSRFSQSKSIPSETQMQFPLDCLTGRHYIQKKFFHCVNWGLLNRM
jgi:hypothetical protein